MSCTEARWALRSSQRAISSLSDRWHSWPWTYRRLTAFHPCETKPNFCVSSNCQLFPRTVWSATLSCPLISFAKWRITLSKPTQWRVSGLSMRSSSIRQSLFTYPGNLYNLGKRFTSYGYPRSEPLKKHMINTWDKWVSVTCDGVFLNDIGVRTWNSRHCRDTLESQLGQI